MTNLTQVQRERLDKLATYLERLPRRTRRFDMARWVSGLWGEDAVKYARKNGGMCGTAACAAGYGPAAGVLMPPRLASNGYVDWEGYCQLFVGSSVPRRAWVFNGAWACVDNTPHGAAARIRYLLAKDSPPEGFAPTSLWAVRVSRSFCKLYAPYRRDTDGSPKGRDAQRLDGEAATAGAEGIAPSGPSQ